MIPDAIRKGDRVKWMRLYRGGVHCIHYGVVIEVEVGAEIPQAIVQPKDGTPAQRVDYASLLRAEDSNQPQPNAWDLLCRRGGCLHEVPRRERISTYITTV